MGIILKQPIRIAFFGEIVCSYVTFYFTKENLVPCAWPYALVHLKPLIKTDRGDWEVLSCPHPVCMQSSINGLGVAFYCWIIITNHENVIQGYLHLIFYLFIELKICTIIFCTNLFHFSPPPGQMLMSLDIWHLWQFMSECEVMARAIAEKESVRVCTCKCV